MQGFDSAEKSSKCLRTRTSYLRNFGSKMKTLKKFKETEKKLETLKNTESASF